MLKERWIDWDPTTGVVHSPPQQIFVEVTGRCNLACVHCSKDYGLPAARDEVDLSAGTLGRLMPWLHRARFVNLNVVGEPLLVEGFEDLVERIAAGGAEVGFNTNGLLLSDSRCDRLVAGGLRSITISFDGMDYNRRVRGVPWEAILDRMRALDRAKRRAAAAEPHVGLAYTLMRGNLPELVPLLERVLPEVDVHAVHIQPLVVFYETVRGENAYEAEAVDDVLARAREVCAIHDTELVVFRSQFGQDERSQDLTAQIRELGPYSETHGCTDPFFEVKVRSDGRLDACSFGRSPDADLGERDLGEIWNGEWYRSLRLALAAGRYEGECSGCPYIHGCAVNQQTPLRPGVHHSRSEQFRGRSSPSA